MAGLWERIRPDVNDRVETHYIVAAYKGYHSGIFTKAQILTALNNLLETPLTTAEQTDMDDIADQIDAQTNNTTRLMYLNGIEALWIAVEAEQVLEAKWRSDLGI